MTMGKCMLVAQRSQGGFMAVTRSQASSLRGQIVVSAWLHGDPESEDGKYLIAEVMPSLSIYRESDNPNPQLL